MLTSLGLIFLSGLIMGKIFELLKLPSLIGRIIAGMILGPYLLDLLDPSILGISGDLRQLALIIILTRAGLSLDLNDLKKLGRPALLLCFLPASLEIIGFVLFAPRLLGLTILEAAIMGSVIAAVSPAIVVPRMISLIEGSYGRKNSIPQLIMAAASVDDVFVIILFTGFTSLAMGASISAMDLVEVPLSIVLGIIVGVMAGLLVIKLFRLFKIGGTNKLIIILSISFLLLELEKILANIVGMSGLLSIMTLGLVISRARPKLATELALKYNRLWLGAEILLFVLVGASLDLNYLLGAGIPAILMILIGLGFRMLAVYISLLKTRLSRREKIFSMIAYTPKATVQAAIGSVPLTMGLACGQDVLSLAVLSILITAPLGAIGIDSLYNKLLEVE